ncbi:MAG: LysR substrate-binding domain-containing protein [Phenylobacterium sp.]|uniref:LysR substrate-binding domain-containing protein n=1 Tax=Phenylobacterium sp. TaxID=1871053 RepID=UPI0027317FB7|nr:LysR substrate-binding domain-containing protein [Phenylobacterium sp.]MDP2012555.1 LysR substrate-binding domain-containing protein [Phenylobacterium sp.]
MLELWRLGYFVAVAEEENVGRAAARLGVSQSPLSQRIRELEAGLGLALFHRERRRLRLTAEGWRFLDQARALLAHAAGVEQQAKAAGRGEGGRLSLGFVEGAVHAGVLGRALRRFRHERPGVGIELRAMRSGDQVQALREGALDVAHVYTPPAESAGLRIALVAEEPYRLAIPADHRLAADTHLVEARLDGEAFIALPEQGNPQARAEWIAACRASGFAPDVRIEAVEPTTILGLVAAGVGLAMVQESLAGAAPAGVVMRPLPTFPLRMRVFAVVSESASAAARAYFELTRT